jgi:hypothetical protein
MVMTSPEFYVYKSEYRPHIHVRKMPISMKKQQIGKSFSIPISQKKEFSLTVP